MRIISTICLLIVLAGCSASTDLIKTNPELVTSVEEYSAPAPRRGPIIVGVYSYNDLTGQRQGTTLSSAVTQGAENYLIDALKSYSEGKWFRVVERKSIDNLVRERQIIRSTREEATGTSDSSNLPTMLYAGILIEGGIISYDTNTISGGEGVRIFGIGLSDKYTKHKITIGLRAVSVATTEVLTSIIVEKEIISTSENFTTIKFFDLERQVIELEAGTNSNEPSSYALKTAIEKAVHELVQSGLTKKIW